MTPTTSAAETTRTSSPSESSLRKKAGLMVVVRTLYKIGIVVGGGALIVLLETLLFYGLLEIWAYCGASTHGVAILSVFSWSLIQAILIAAIVNWQDITTTWNKAVQKEMNKLTMREEGWWEAVAEKEIDDEWSTK